MPPKKRAQQKKKVPDDFMEGEKIYDTEKTATNEKPFILGPVIGQGGFGKIHLARVENRSSTVFDRVIKFEFVESGPLFCEHHFFLRVGLDKDLQAWKREKGLKHFGFPTRYAFGRYKKNELIYRYLVLGRYGEDIEKIFNSLGRKFSEVVVAQLAINIINVLEFIHVFKYVHADIKGSNILSEARSKSTDPSSVVYLVDYGLATKYSLEYKEYKAQKHNGTKEFTSRDAHKGAKPSRSGDLEILGYCLLQWSEGVLPWETESDNERIFKRKDAFFKNLRDHQFSSKAVEAYFTKISTLDYSDEPAYTEYCRLFETTLTEHRRSLSPIDFYRVQSSSSSKRKKAKSNPQPQVFSIDSDSDDEPSTSASTSSPRKQVRRVNSENEKKAKKSSYARLEVGAAAVSSIRFSPRLREKEASKSSELEQTSLTNSVGIQTSPWLHKKKSQK